MDIPHPPPKVPDISVGFQTIVADISSMHRSVRTVSLIDIGTLVPPAKASHWMYGRAPAEPLQLRRGMKMRTVLVSGQIAEISVQMNGNLPMWD